MLSVINVPEFDDSVGDDDDEMVRPNKKRERTKKDPTFMEGISNVTPVTQPTKLRDLQKKIQHMCDWKR